MNRENLTEILKAEKGSSAETILGKIDIKKCINYSYVYSLSFYY